MPPSRQHQEKDRQGLSQAWSTIVKGFEIASLRQLPAVDIGIRGRSWDHPHAKRFLEYQAMIETKHRWCFFC